MYTGITIEELIATVARVEAKVDKRRKEEEELLHFPVAPFREDLSLVAHPGVA